MVIACAEGIDGHAHGVPWKLAPVRNAWSSGRKIGLSPTPLASISICSRVQQLVAGSADDLRRRAHAVGVLDLDLLLAGNQLRSVVTSGGWPRRSPRRGSRGAHESARRRASCWPSGPRATSPGDLRLLGASARIKDGQGRQWRQQVRTVDDREAVTRLEAGRDPGLLEALPG